MTLERQEAAAPGVKREAAGARLLLKEAAEGPQQLDTAVCRAEAAWREAAVSLARGAPRGRVGASAEEGARWLKGARPVE